jgi:hypothetical protein
VYRPTRPAALLALALAALLARGIAASADAPWDELTDAVGLTADTAQLEPGRWRDGGRYPLSLFTRLWDDWRLIDGEVLAAGREALAAEGAFAPLVAMGAARIDAPIEPAPAQDAGPPSYVRGNPLALAIAELQDALGPPLSRRETAKLHDAAAGVDPWVAEAAAVLLRAVPEAVAKRDAALEGFGGRERAAAAFASAMGLAGPGSVDGDTLSLLDTLDRGALMTGGHRLAAAMDEAAHILATADRAPAADKAGAQASAELAAADISFEWDTPLGAVIIDGSGDSHHGTAAPLLLIDLASNDS